MSQVELLVDGMRCPACAWLIERALLHLPGVESVRPNLTLGRIQLRADLNRTPLSAIASQLGQLGYTAGIPGLAASAPGADRLALKRLFVAGIGAMQVMMLAEPMYFAAFGEALSEPIRDLFRWLSAVLTLPVLLYAGHPYLRGARHEIAQRAPAMDTLITIALWTAYLASLVVTMQGGAEVYFEAVTMFLFFLTLGRMLEARALLRARATIDRLASRHSLTARRLSAGEYVEVDPLELAVGDQVLVRSGEALPGDAVLLSSHARFDEALLTGEATAVSRRHGDRVIAGAVVVDGPIEARLTVVGPESTLARLERAIHDADRERPRLADLADRTARHFTVGLLLIAAVTAVVWFHIDPERALPITLAVLAAACPCAFALAIPTAYTAAQGALAGRGVVVLRQRLFDALAHIDTVVFDKTGTLTIPSAQPILSFLAEGIEQAEVEALASALEAHSAHPLARAFTREFRPALALARIEETPGAGVAAELEGRRIRIGRPSFAAVDSCEVGAATTAVGTVWLADEQRVLAVWRLDEQLRPEAADLVAALIEQGLDVRIQSGDTPARVTRIGQRLGLAADAVAGGRSSEQKLAALWVLRQAGHRVLMVGDGLNDGPILASADASLAVAGSLDAVHQAADGVLVNCGLDALLDALASARRTRSVVLQNFAWAVGYNLIAVAAAVCGWLPPWAAALGMTLSSLIVISNSTRLLHTTKRAPEWPAVAPAPAQ